MPTESQLNEVFRTPKIVYYDLFNREQDRNFWLSSRILDPSAGDGRMIKTLVRAGNRNRHGLVDVRSKEMRRWQSSKLLTHCDVATKDYLHFNTRQRYDAVLTNPPFTKSKEFVEHSFNFVDAGGKIVFLQKLQWLGTQKRSMWLKEDSGLQFIFVIPYRIKFEIDGYANRTSKDEYAWYVFTKGYIGLPKLDWLI